MKTTEDLPFPEIYEAIKVKLTERCYLTIAVRESELKEFQKEFECINLGPVYFTEENSIDYVKRQIKAHNK